MIRTPCFAARFSAGATALASLPAMAMTPTFCETKLLMNSICASAVACEGACLHDVAADLLGGLLGAALGDLEVGVGVELGQEADRHRPGGAFLRRWPAGRGATAPSAARQQCRC